MEASFDRVLKIMGYENRSLFVNFDIGLVRLQEDLKASKLESLRRDSIGQKEYDNANGIYIKILFNEEIYSGIIETKTLEESRKIFYELPIKLAENDIIVTSLMILPLQRSTFHPFFDFFDNMIFNYENDMRIDYWNKQKLDLDSVANWYYDYMKYRREIIYKHAPNVEFLYPFVICPLKSYIILYDEGKGIINRYYYSNDKDEVKVKEIIKIDINNLDKLYEEIFNVHKKDMITEGRSRTYINEKVYLSWNHPFVEALKDVKEGLTRYNESQPSIDFNSYQLTISKINHWTFNEIKITREIYEMFPEIRKYIQFWNQPINVLNIYYIHRPEKNRRVDGRIISYYVQGEEDEIISTMTFDIDETKTDYAILRKYFPNNTNEPFLTSNRSITSYLASKLGMKY